MSVTRGDTASQATATPTSTPTTGVGRPHERWRSCASPSDSRFCGPSSTSSSPWGSPRGTTRPGSWTGSGTPPGSTAPAPPRASSSSGPTARSRGSTTPSPAPPWSTGCSCSACSASAWRSPSGSRPATSRRRPPSSDDGPSFFLPKTTRCSTTTSSARSAWSSSRLSTPATPGASGSGSPVRSGQGASGPPVVPRQQPSTLGSGRLLCVSAAAPATRVRSPRPSGGSAPVSRPGPAPGGGRCADHLGAAVAEPRTIVDHGQHQLVAADSRRPPPRGRPGVPGDAGHGLAEHSEHCAADVGWARRCRPRRWCAPWG